MAAPGNDRRRWTVEVDRSADSPFASPRAPDVLAGALVWLLIVNIRNAWDLALFMARKHTESK